MDARAVSAEAGVVRQVSVERLFADSQARLDLHWVAGRQGGNRVLTGEAALKPTIGQVGHMNLSIRSASRSWVRRSSPISAR